LIWNGTGPVLEEITGYWDSPELASQHIANDRNYLAANADGCSEITYGTTIESKGVYPVGPPPACLNPGARLAAGQFTKTPSGTFQAAVFIIELQCGGVTFLIGTGTGGLGAAQVYLNSAVTVISSAQQVIPRWRSDRDHAIDNRAG
jgi:hypothetical protein